MKLGDVLRKERERKRLSAEDIAAKLGLPVGAYLELESGTPLFEDWAPRLPELAMKLLTPTSRLISETGKVGEAGQAEGQLGRLVKANRERCALSREELARQLGWSPEQLALVESGEGPLERYAPLLLRFAELIDQPIFNLFYPCGLPFAEIKNYP